MDTNTAAAEDILNYDDIFNGLKSLISSYHEGLIDYASYKQDFKELTRYINDLAKVDFLSEMQYESFLDIYTPELEHIAAKESQESDYFKDLKVIFHYSEMGNGYFPADLEGNPYPNDRDLTLVGPAAYEFLAAINRLDKVCYFDGEYFKCSLSIIYEGYSTTTRVDLGSLAFNNAASVAEALKAHIPFDALTNQFSKEETDYLTVHSELKEYNNYKAPVFYYRIPNDLKPKFLSGFIKKELSAKEFGPFGFCENTQYGKKVKFFKDIGDYRPATMQEMLDSTYSIVESAVRVDRNYNDFQNNNSHFVLPEKEYNSIIEPIKDFTLHIESEDSIGEETYSGLQAIYKLDRLYRDDVNEYISATRQGYHFPAPKKTIKLYHNNKLLFDIINEPGDRALVNLMPDGLCGAINDEPTINALKTLSFYSKFRLVAATGQRNNYDARNAVTSTQELPDLQTSYDNFRRKNPVHCSSFFSQEDGYHYERLLKFIPGSLEDKAACLLIQAAKDGFTYTGFKKCWTVLPAELKKKMLLVYSKSRDIKARFSANKAQKGQGVAR